MTTVDPAIAAGQAGSAAQRIAYYDQQPSMAHTIIGGTNAWLGYGGGVSTFGGMGNANVPSGNHTNWFFSADNFDLPFAAADGSAHENGHMLGLQHQTIGPAGGTSFGEEGYAPLMGISYYQQRSTWRDGFTEPGSKINEILAILSNPGMQLEDDGIGHTFATASSLAINLDGTVNVASSNSEGFIVPTAASGYSTSDYTKDIFAFSASGGALNLTVNDGNDFLTPGVADPGATMRALLNIYSSTGVLVATGTETLDTMATIFSGTLDPGSYYAEILSYGAVVTTNEPDNAYFNMGGYFLTGSGFVALPVSVPEPGTITLLGLALALIFRRAGGRPAAQIK